ncbi:ATP-dependent protease ATPase subunit HslU [Shouchella shacheensis]|uniref:ATP-dependent protease ATPase subunit HslU n=1 Tax=Shouchella shacheensis TaxID=1649580 RepID=UPI00073FB4A3|nr:ATP-dependent protease ATPase subunit HslU [Shouchella shacheensis]
MNSSLTPKQIVERLNQYIVGQESAKKSVAIALRNRYRRTLLDESIREEITPKNILMIGPTGVGKTEIARRLAKLVGAPFIKVEATKFTEVGYVGRDVESMVRDLVESSVRIVKEERMASVREQAKEQAEKRIVDLLVPSAKKESSFKNPFEMLFSQGESEKEETEKETEEEESRNNLKQKMAQKLEQGELEERIVTVEVSEQNQSFMDMFQGGQGMEQMGMNMQEMLGNMMPKKKKKRRMSVADARKVLAEEEAQKLIDMDDVSQEAVNRTEQLGIIFIDEIDKVAGKSEQSADVSREGVQRDILPIVEGSTVVTKYGPVKTDHVLFMAAGAFHIAKPSDLIPELQGRFPIRVELSNLSVDDFVRILVEPDNALIKQYAALLKTEGINISFSDEAVRKIATIATEVNQETENIGARRLHTLLEKLLEELSYEAPDITLNKVDITPEYVDEKLGTIAKNRDMSQYIL